jgi:protein KRI1
MSNTKQQLFSDNESEEADLKINKEYADRHQYNEKRKELEKIKEKYGTNPENWGSEEDASSSSEEDSDAELMTTKAQSKVLNLLASIQNKDKHAELLKHEGEYFNDSDFEENDEKSKKRHKKEKKITYKDVIRKEALKKIDKGESSGSSSNSDEDSDDQNHKKSKSKKKDKLFEKSKTETFAEEQ